ncbi:unnamed protein product [Arabis nemorensis]|uniref:Uncharacterized protein n=1 Tax=Arabis nemorensis TaxID=586526 RepID=A0A565AUJ5_9BRAS|nr:unnamed protein product [Arabis nemorensis]
MKTNDHGLLLLSLFSIFSLLHFPYLAISETPCPYVIHRQSVVAPPCRPRTTQPPPYPPPAVNYPSPAGNIPNYFSPPYNVGGRSDSGLYGPPPPDAIYIAVSEKINQVRKYTDLRNDREK